MRSLLTKMLLAACVLVAVPTAARAQSLLFDYLGFDYEDPKAPASQFGDIGNGYVGLGTVPYLFAPIVSNTALNEYTYVMSGLNASTITTVGPYRIIDYTPGTITIYEDAILGGTTADFGASPPNLVAPPTFTDGTPILVGQLTSFRFAIDNSNGTGSFEAVFTVTGGSQLGNFPLNQRAGWTFAGSTGNALNIPAGYAHQIDGQTFLNAPVSVRRTSWGRLKAGYR